MNGHGWHAVEPVSAKALVPFKENAGNGQNQKTFDRNRARRGELMRPEDEAFTVGAWWEILKPKNWRSRIVHRSLFEAIEPGNAESSQMENEALRATAREPGGGFSSYFSQEDAGLEAEAHEIAEERI